MRQRNFKDARRHFARILAELQQNQGEHGQFLRVYRALTIVELTMSSGNLAFEEKKHRLQNAIFYSDKASLVARNYGTDRGEKALVKLQRAIVDGRMAQLDAKHGRIDDVARDWQSTASSRINSALDELRWSNHEGFEDSHRWAQEWLQSFRHVQPH